MTKFFTMLALSAAMLLTMVGTAHAKAAKKPAAITGTISSATTTMIVIDSDGDKGKRMTFQITKDTTVTGDLVKGAKVSVTAHGDKAKSIDVTSPSSDTAKKE